MYRLNFLTRESYTQIKIAVFNATTRTIQNVQTRLNSNTTGSNSSDDESEVKRKEIEQKKSKEALDKLNKLLMSMTGEEILSSKSKLNLAQPVSQRKKTPKEKTTSKSVKAEPPEAQIINAAKQVAESAGGDVKQIQSDLITKLLNVTNDRTPTKIMDLVKGMEIEQEHSRTQQVKKHLQTHAATDIRKSPKAPPTDIEIKKIDLFGSDPLGIFKELKDASEGVENKTWNQLYQKDLKLAVTHPPSNYFQQMILWTEQGKVWKFPINNEQGLEEEKQVYFTEHVFLEKHLEPWCPHRGPLRHFMELVCVGLSKNPYLTVEAKKEHIEWFKNYFADKKKLLVETGAIQEETEIKHIER